MLKFLIYLSILSAMLCGCESVNYLKSEIGGSAKPTGGIKEVVPVEKTYPVSNAQLRHAVLETLDEKGYMYTENTGRIITEPKPIGDQSQFGFLGATYYSRLMLSISGSTIKFIARFNKDSNLTQDEQNIEYPEKENELRKNFYATLDKKLGVSSSNQIISSQNKTVYKVQERLTELGYNLGPIDGIMGGKTINAIIKFQKDNGLPENGKIDDKTINKLGI